MKYEIDRSAAPIVTCVLEEREKLVTESGLTVTRSPNTRVWTSADVRFSRRFARIVSRLRGFGRPVAAVARFCKMTGRFLTGGAFFHLVFYPRKGSGRLSFSSHYIGGTILPLSVTPKEGFLVGRGGFLASEKKVRLCNRYIGIKNGLFGEGFFLQHLTGRGTAFVDAESGVVRRELKEKEQLVCDVGMLLAASDSCTVRSRFAGCVTDAVFGGKNLFNTVVTGPGTVYLNM